MLYTLQFHKLAYREFIDATEWYEMAQEGLGNKFIADFEKAIERIIANPAYYSKIAGNFRQLKVDNFPFTIVYEFYPRKSIIHIAAVHHTKRKPNRRFRKP